MTQIRLEIDGKDMSHRWGWFALFGILLIVGGLFMLWQLTVATIASVIFFGAVVLAGGAVQIVHAFTLRGWRGFLPHFLLGLLYVAFGFLVFVNPILASVALTLVLAALLVASGIVRIVMAVRHWPSWGWLLVLSGVFAILAGLVIFAGWPWTGLWVLGLLLGIDFILYGIGWVVFAFALMPRRA
jgi:uncharacterized membrane protein HdeD (DUF308 family)